MGLFFKNDVSIIEKVKKIPGSRWDPEWKCWHIGLKYGETTNLSLHFKGFAEIEKKEADLNEEFGKHLPLIDGRSVTDEYIKVLRLKQYSLKTIKTYTAMFHLFMNYFSHHEVGQITGEEIREYLIYLTDEKGVSQSYQNQAINAIKFYYEKVLGHTRKSYFLQRPRPETHWPSVLSEEEVLRLLKQVKNLKQKAALSVIYSSGLRIGELINLRIEDIDTTRAQIRIRQGKGKKDRVPILSPNILKLLRNTIKNTDPRFGFLEANLVGNIAQAAFNRFSDALRIWLGSGNLQQSIP
jgi:integrase/recombinase XerD